MKTGKSYQIDKFAPFGENFCASFLYLLHTLPNEATNFVKDLFE